MILRHMGIVLMLTSAVTLISCFAGISNHGYGYDYHYYDADTGLHYRDDRGTGRDPQTVIDIWRRTASCMGAAELNAPMVIYTDDPQACARFDSESCYLADPPLVIIGTYAEWTAELYAVRHELVHYILDVTTGDLDPEHSSPAFDVCVH